MAKKENRSEVTMRCSVCGFELRPVSKNKKNTPDRLELNRYFYSVIGSAFRTKH